MLLIYQIGDIPLFFELKALADDSISVKTGRDWKVPFAEFSGVSGQTFVGDPYKPVVEAQKIDIDGSFICDEKSNADTLMRRLSSLGGIAQMPVIALRYQECSHVDATQCCSLCNPTLDWIVNYGIITSIKANSEYFNSKEPWGTGVQGVSLTMQLGTKWKELSSYEWDYRQTQVINPFLQLQANSTGSIPFSFDGVNPRSYFYKLSTSASRYDPSYWAVKYAKTYGGVGSGFDDLGTFELISNPAVWSAPPNSVYAFTNMLSVSASLSLKVRRQLGAFSSVIREEESTLSLSQLNTDLASGGYGGLYQSDIIITGFANPFPGFVIRDGSILTVRPRWIYPGLYPGETGIGYNQIVVSAAGNPVQFAYLHDFGMY